MRIGEGEGGDRQRCSWRCDGGKTPKGHFGETALHTKRKLAVVQRPPACGQRPSAAPQVFYDVSIEKH